MPLITRRRFGAALLACAVLAPPAHAAPTWLSGSALSIPVRDGAWTTPAALGADGEALLLSARGGFGVKPVLGFVRTAPAALSGVTPATVMDGSENRDSLTLTATASGAAVGAWITGSATSARVITADRPAGAAAFDTPVALTTPGPRVSQLRLAGNAKGDFALAYTKDDTVVVRVRPAGAATFGDEQLVSTAAARSSALAVTPSGEVLVTWLQANRLHAAVRTATTFGAAQRVGAESVPTSDSPASVAAGPDGRVVIAYAEGDKIVVADRAPGASTVGAPVTLPDSGRNTYETVPAQVAFDTSGAVSVVWTTGASTVAGRVHVATRTASATAFGAAVALSPETGAIVRSATIATHPAGTASAVVWRQQVGSTRSIQGAWRRTATSSFAAAQTLGSASDVENPRLAVSPEGDALATWASDAGYDPDWEENQWSARAAVLDAAGPKLEISAPETVSAGTQVALSATAQDAWSALDGAVRWTFGDGHSATGATAEHRYADPGTYEVSATAADAVGNSTTVRRTVRVTAVAAAPGPQWLDPVTISEPSDTAPEVRVGLSGGGDAVAVWPQGERSASDDAAPATVRGAVRPLGTAWVPQASGLSTPGLTGTGAAVTIADSGEALAAWAESPSREVRSATRRAGDRSFGQILQRGQAGSTGAPTPALAGGVRGDAVLVWTVDAGERLQGRVRPAGAADFGAVQTLSPEGMSGGRPVAAVGDDGTAVVAWRRSNGDGGGVLVAVRAAGSPTFAPAVVLGSGSGSNPAVTVGSSGAAAVAWAGSVDGANRVHVAVKAAGATTFGAPHVIAGSGSNAYDTIPQDVSLAADGTLTALWSTGAVSTPGAVWAATLRPGQPAFGAPEQLSPEGVDTLVRQTVIDGNAAGDVVAVWWQQAVGGEPKLRAARRARGAQTFGASELVDGSGRGFSGPQVDIDAEGNVLVGYGVAAERSSIGALSGWTARVRAFDAAGPRVAPELPATVTAGVPVTLRAGARDVSSSVASVQWQLGDGATAAGAEITHTWRTPGRRTVTVTATDTAGLSTTRTADVEVVAAPVVTPTPTPTPTVTPAATAPPTPQPTVPVVTPVPTPTATPGPAALKVDRVALTATRVRLRASGAGKVRVTVERRVTRKGKARWKVQRRATTTIARAGTVTVKVKRLAAGRYRVKTQPVGGRTTTSKTFVIRKR